MYHRYHAGAKRNASGKWEHLPHTGIAQVASETIGDWTLELAHRQVGVSIKRDQFSVKLYRQTPPYEELLSGFATKDAALAAARKRVDLLSHLREPRVRPPHPLRSHEVRQG
jgi:hypothetical protein